MTMKTMIPKCALIFLFSFSAGYAATNPFSFPTNFEESDDKIVSHKIPYATPLSCLSGEVFYPGNEINDWVCDCQPGYLYDSENDQCYKAYRQGPCSTGQYLAFSDNSLKAECQPNDCTVDGQVRFREKCYELGSNGPCAVDKLLPIFTKLNINETTLQIECVVSKLSESGSRFGEEDSKNSELTVVSKYPAAACFRGSRRAYLNQCSQLNSGYPSHDNF